MSYGGPENTIEELEFLKGATIFDIKIDDEKEETTMLLRLKPGLAVNNSVIAVVGVWQDVEGNGPGYLAYLGGSEAV